MEEKNSPSAPSRAVQEARQRLRVKWIFIVPMQPPRRPLPTIVSANLPLLRQRLLLLHRPQQAAVW